MKFDRSFQYKGLKLEGYSKQKFQKISARRRSKRSPDGAGQSFVILGELIENKEKAKTDGKSSKKSRPKTRAKTFRIRDREEHVLDVYPVGTFDSLSYRIIGYIPVEGGYVVVRKSNLLYALLALVLALLLLGGSIYFLLTGGTSLDKNAVDYDPPISRPVDWDSSSILIPGYETLNIAAGTTEMNVIFYNPDDNPCYFEYELVLKDTGESLYKSKLIPPGKAVKEEELNRPLEKGVYPVTIIIRTFSIEDEEVELNTGQIETEIAAIELSQ